MRKFFISTALGFHLPKRWSEIVDPVKGGRKRPRNNGLNGWQQFETRGSPFLKGSIIRILEGQYHPRFAIEACRAQGIKDFVLAVVTCEEQTWVARLHGPRAQPELVTQDMRNWARVLREETTKAGGAVIDTTEANVGRNMSDVGKLVNVLLARRVRG